MALSASCKMVQICTVQPTTHRLDLDPNHSRIGEAQKSVASSSAQCVPFPALCHAIDILCSPPYSHFLLSPTGETAYPDVSSLPPLWQLSLFPCPPPFHPLPLKLAATSSCPFFVLSLPYQKGLMACSAASLQTPSPLL